MVLYMEIKKNIYHHGDTEDTENNVRISQYANEPIYFHTGLFAHSHIFSVLFVQGKRLPGGHREGTSFRRDTNLCVLRVSVLIIYNS
jgi:hypothetical protein